MPATASSVPVATLRAALQRVEQRLRLRPDDGQAQDDAGVLQFQMGDLPAAIASAERATTLRPKDALAYDHLALFRLEAGRPREAIAAARRAVALAPRQGPFHLNLGNALLAADEPAAAVSALQRATELLPREPLAWLNLGNALARAGRRREGIDTLRRAVAADSRLEAARRNLALLLREDGRPAEAAAALAPLTRSDDPAVLHLLGILLLDSGKPSAALEPLERAVALRPDDSGGQLDLARCLLRLERMAEATRAGRIAARLAPQNPAVWNLLGLCSPEAADAETCYRRALALRAPEPDAAINLARLLVAAGRAPEALSPLDAFLAASPLNAETHFTRAVVLRELDRTAEARAANLRAVELQPTHANARWNLALCNLRLGRFLEGWAGYEGRWQYEAKEPRRYSNRPDWPPDSPIDGHLLAWGEQGIGDEVLFSGCLGAIAGRVRQLTLACAPRLAPLFQRSFPNIAVVAQPSDGSNTSTEIPVDWQIPLGSLPARCWTAEGPPHAGAPWLRADPARAAELRHRYTPDNAPLIGLSWRTSNPHTGAARSIAPAIWAPALASLGARCLSLQYGDCSIDLAAARSAGLELIGDPAIDPLGNLDGFAAQVAAVDAVISIDNSTAHFAGALGRPTWVLLPTPCDWRWGLATDSSPWYASVRLQRRAPGQNWEAVLDRTVAEVCAHLQATSPSSHRPLSAPATPPNYPS